MNPLEVPEKFEGFLRPYRYKGAYGGRGSAKSWTVASLLVNIAARQHEFVVCAREFQNSIEDSVYRLLESRIKYYGLPYVFKKTHIECTATGSEFVFKGLSKMDGASLKSLEGATKLWVEEGQNVSAASWDNVIPTIRAEGSEIWCTWNPSVVDAPTEIRWIHRPPPNSYIVKVNYNDNPWFPDVLEQERLHMLRTDPVAYENVWEGVPRSFAEGAIFKDEMDAMKESGRIGMVPHDPTKPVFPVFDLGHAAGGKSDPHSIIFAQAGSGTTHNIIDHWEGNNMALPKVISDVLLQKPYRYAKVILPHDANRTNSQTSKTDVEVFTDFWLETELLERTPDLDKDMNNIRSVIPNILIDETKCAGLLASMRNHRRERDEKTGLWRFKHDWTSHAVSSMRYLCVYINMNGGLNPVVHYSRPAVRRSGALTL